MNIVQTGRIRGFTLVELIVVIAIIGILAAIVILGLTRYQTDTRDARRTSSAVVIAEALEKYYDGNGEYPSCSAVSAAGSTVTSTTLKGLEQSTLIAPNAASSETNSIKCNSAGNLLTINGTDFYEYVGDGSATCNATGSCLEFKLKYKAESGPEILTITSRRTTDIATSGNITNLSASSSSFTSYSLAWAAIQNTTSYTIQAASDNSFINNLQTTSSATTSATMNGYVAGTTRYFRVKPVSGAAGGAWSNVATATTRQLNTPVISTVVNSPTQVTASWAPITYAATYKIQRSTTSAFPVNATTQEYTQAAGAGTQSRVFTDSAAGATRYYRVQALATGDTSNWSNIVSATPAAPPAPYTLTRADPQYNIVRSTSSAVCAAGTTPYYYWYYNGSPWVQGTQYKVVDASFPQWNYTITVSGSARCQTADYQSAYVAANNSTSRSLWAPTAWAGNDAWREVAWGGGCPAGTSSYYINWSVSAYNWSASGTTYNTGGRYTNYGAAWGDGMVYATIYCYSAPPWGWNYVSGGGQGCFGQWCG